MSPRRESGRCAAPAPARAALALLVVLLGPAALTSCSSGADAPPTPAAPAGIRTGVPADVTLTAAGATTVTGRGTVLDGLDVRGTVTVDAPDVTIRRSRVACGPGDFYAVVVQPGASATIVDTELTGECSSGALQGQDFVARRVDIHGVTSDGIKIDGGNVLIEESTVRDFTPSDAAHADGIQASVPIGNVVIRDSVIDPGPDANGAIFLVPQLENGSRPGPVLLEGNTFGGGGDTVHIGADTAGGIGEVRVVDNVWRRNSAFGPVYRTGLDPAEWTGNRFEDGTPVGPP